MVTATLTFNLPEDQYEFDTANQSLDIKGDIIDSYNTIRDMNKYDMPKFEKAEDLLEYITTQFIETLGEYIE